MSYKIFTNARIIDPASNLDRITDLHVKNGLILKIGKASQRDLSVKPELYNCKGKLITPGFVDLHTHLREPGGEEKETIHTGTRAAAAGGFTTIVSMPNTTPPIDSPEMIHWVKEKAKHEGLVEVLPCGAVTKERKGDELVEMLKMHQEGAVAFSDDGSAVANPMMLKNAMLYAKGVGVPLFQHAEDKQLSFGGSMRECYHSTIWGLRGIPASAESSIIARDIEIAREYGGHIHFCHVSTRASVELIRQAKKSGVHVTCETCPHYFSLTTEAIDGYDTNAKMNPPLGEPEDVAAVIAGLADGTIDAIATDHAPHHIDDKNVEFDNAAFGIIGLETAWSIAYTELVKKHNFSLKAVVKLFTINPAQVIHSERGTLKPGSIANFTVINPDFIWTVNAGDFCSLSQNSPYIGQTLYSRPESTWVRGNLVYEFLI